MRKSANSLTCGASQFILGEMGIGLRDKAGRFVNGHAPVRGSGRPSGRMSGTSIDLREVRARIVDSWRTVDGDALLAQLAEDDPKGYIQVVVSLLPKSTESEIRGQFTTLTVHTLAEKLLGPCASAAARQFTESVIGKALEPGGTTERGFVSPGAILETLGSNYRDETTESDGNGRTEKTAPKCLENKDLRNVENGDGGTLDLRVAYRENTAFWGQKQG